MLAVSRVETGHYVHFTKSGGYIENLIDGSRIPMQLKNGVYVIKLWVKVAGKPKAKGNVLGTLSGGPRQAPQP